MPILALDDLNGTFDHQCGRCGYIRTGLSLDPLVGHLTVSEDSLTTAPCPQCRTTRNERGQEIIVVESFRRDIPAHEAGEGPHPGSLVGTQLPGHNGVVNMVTEHTHGYALTHEHVEQARLIRRMQQHPTLAQHAPLRVP